MLRLCPCGGIARCNGTSAGGSANRPEHVDPALPRPGRFDQVVWMGLPDQLGRADLFEHYLRGLKLGPQLTPDRLAAELASAAHGLTGADIAYL